MMWMPLRAPKMKPFIFGFQRLVWWPKWTPASIISRMVIGASEGAGWTSRTTLFVLAVSVVVSMAFSFALVSAACVIGDRNLVRDEARTATSTGVWCLRAGGFYHKLVI